MRKACEMLVMKLFCFVDIQNYALRLVKGTTKSPHVGYSPVFPYGWF